MSEGNKEEEIVVPKKLKRAKPIRKRKREDDQEEDPQTIKERLEELKLLQQARSRTKGSDLTVEVSETKGPKTDEPTTFQSLGDTFIKHVDLPDSLEMKMQQWIEENLKKKKIKNDGEEAPPKELPKLVKEEPKEEKPTAAPARSNVVKPLPPLPQERTSLRDTKPSSRDQKHQRVLQPHFHHVPEVALPEHYRLQNLKEFTELQQKLAQQQSLPQATPKVWDKDDPNYSGFNYFDTTPEKPPVMTR
jgi:chemotaxis protein histidine kinase CheA